jgi:hypothetical protein
MKSRLQYQKSMYLQSMMGMIGRQGLVVDDLDENHCQDSQNYDCIDDFPSTAGEMRRDNTPSPITSIVNSP